MLLETHDADPSWLAPGDFALVPHGEGHRLRSEPGVAAPDILDLDLQHISERYEIIRHGEGARRPRWSAAPSASTTPLPATSSRSCRG